MKFGYACINLSIPNGSPNKRVTLTRLLTMSRDEQIAILYSKSEENMKSLKAIVEWNIKNGIDAYRISSDVFPLATHEAVRDWWKPVSIFEEELAEIGEIASAANHNLSLHPAQFTVLTSPDERIITNSIVDLTHHYEIMEALNLNYTPVINIHGGGKYGDHKAAKERFVYNWGKVPDGAKKMITLENDQTTYNPDDILELCELVKVPMVFDSAHWGWNKGSFSSIEDGLEAAFKTWPDSRIKKVHVSSQKEGFNKHAHADYIEEKDLYPVLYYGEDNDVDFIIMFECKMKNLAIHRLRELAII